MYIKISAECVILKVPWVISIKQAASLPRAVSFVKCWFWGDAWPVQAQSNDLWVNARGVVLFFTASAIYIGIVGSYTFMLANGAGIFYTPLWLHHTGLVGSRTAHFVVWSF